MSRFGAEEAEGAPDGAPVEGYFRAEGAPGEGYFWVNEDKAALKAAYKADAVEPEPLNHQLTTLISKL